jgi:hypothetical protein
MLALSLSLACTPPAPVAPPGAGSPPDTALPHVTIGDRAVDFVLEGHDGAPIRLADHQGQVIVLDLSGFH